MVMRIGIGLLGMLLMALETQADNWPDGSEMDDWFLKAGRGTTCPFPAVMIL